MSHINGEAETKVIWQQDPETNIGATQERGE